MTKKNTPVMLAGYKFFSRYSASVNGGKQKAEEMRENERKKELFIFNNVSHP